MEFAKFAGKEGVIPRFLSSVGVPYRFFLSHVTIHAEETVLFALPA